MSSILFVGSTLRVCLGPNKLGICVDFFGLQKENFYYLFMKSPL